MCRSSLRSTVLVAVLIAAGTFVGACSDDDATGPSSAPASHTLSMDGVRHLPGLDDPVTNCVVCHGANLRGGPSGEPSCYSCHGQVW